MKGYEKWGGLPEILFRSFQLLLRGCTVVIATETWGISRGGTSQWEIMGCCWQNNKCSSFRIFFLSQEELGDQLGSRFSHHHHGTIWCDSNPNLHLMRIFHQNRGIFFTPERISLGQTDLWVSLSWVTWEPKICVMSVLNSPETAECPRYSFVSQSGFSFFYIISLFPCCFLLGIAPGQLGQIALPMARATSGSEPLGNSYKQNKTHCRISLSL